jgi:hypothetical protein
MSSVESTSRRRSRREQRVHAGRLEPDQDLDAGEDTTEAAHLVEQRRQVVLSIPQLLHVHCTMRSRAVLHLSCGWWRDAGAAVHQLDTRQRDRSTDGLLAAQGLPE